MSSIYSYEFTVSGFCDRGSKEKRGLLQKMELLEELYAFLTICYCFLRRIALLEGAKRTPWI